MAGTLNALAVMSAKEPGDNPRGPAGYVSARVLAANVAKTITVPAKAQYVRLAGTADFFFSFSAAATVPVDDDTGASFELVKQQGSAEWYLIPPSTATISIVSAGTPIVTASFYGI